MRSTPEHLGQDLRRPQERARFPGPWPGSAPAAPAGAAAARAVSVSRRYTVGTAATHRSAPAVAWTTSVVSSTLSGIGTPGSRRTFSRRSRRMRPFSSRALQRTTRWRGSWASSRATAVPQAPSPRTTNEVRMADCGEWVNRSRQSAGRDRTAFMIRPAARSHQTGAAPDSPLAENRRSRRPSPADEEGEPSGRARAGQRVSPRTDVLSQGGMRNGCPSPRLSAGARRDAEPQEPSVHVSLGDLLPLLTAGAAQQLPLAARLPRRRGGRHAGPVRGAARLPLPPAVGVKDSPRDAERGEKTRLVPGILLCLFCLCALRALR